MSSDKPVMRRGPPPGTEGHRDESILLTDGPWPLS